MDAWYDTVVGSKPGDPIFSASLSTHWRLQAPQPLVCLLYIGKKEHFDVDSFDVLRNEVVSIVIQDDDVNLASSTLIAEGKAPSEAMGIVISYSLRVKLNCGTLGGELQTDVPFKLLHPAPGRYLTTLWLYSCTQRLSFTLNHCHVSVAGTSDAKENKSSAMKKSKSQERSRYENSCYADDDEDNIVFEDFARLRLNEPDE